MNIIRQLQIETVQETTNPTINDDSTKGFKQGHLWANTSSNVTYVCKDPGLSAGTAVWEILEHSGSGLWTENGTDLEPAVDGSNVNLLTGGLKDTNVTTAVDLGDSSNTSFNTTNKTIIGAVNELSAGVAVAVVDEPTVTNGQTVFTLSQTPISDAAFAMYLNGQRQNITSEYTRSGTTVTWLNPGGVELVDTDSVIFAYNDVASAVATPTTGDYLNAYRLATQALVTGPGTNISFNNVALASGWTPSGDAFVPAVTGVYHISIEGTFTNPTDATWDVLGSLRINGVDDLSATKSTGTIAQGLNGHIHLQSIVSVTAGQTVVFLAQPSSANCILGDNVGVGAFITASINITRLS